MHSVRFHIGCFTVLDDLQVVLVTNITEVTDVTGYIRANDIIIAVNGTCLAVMDKNQTMVDWKAAFNSLKAPRLVTLFRLFENGPSVFNPFQVGGVDFALTL